MNSFYQREQARKRSEAVKMYALSAVMILASIAMLLFGVAAQVTTFDQMTRIACFLIALVSFLTAVGAAIAAFSLPNRG